MRIVEQLTVADTSSVGEGRRIATRLADGLGFDVNVRGKIAIVVSELVTNLVKYGGGGELVLESEEIENFAKLHIYAYDQGPGMENVQKCMEDGYSSSGTVGGGLGAISRLPDTFDIYSRPGKGTAIYCSFSSGSPIDKKSLEWAALNFNYPGETVSGDDYAHFDCDDYSLVMVTDGLGHGPLANDASKIAVECFHAHTDLMPAQIMTKLHAALIHTRGAAVGIAHIHHHSRELTYSGMGNISAQIITPDKVQTLLSSDGIVGGNARRFPSTVYPWPTDALLVMFSDGLTSKLRLDLESYPGFVFRSSNVLASILMRDFKRGRDDATVLVAKQTGAKYW
ncbi:MAG: serine/threonine protein kinase [Proteobacteria bacterium]|nr:MAG: serine/threonine protein kinase [Pseudomonadota bacterium]